MQKGGNLDLCLSSDGESRANLCLDFTKCDSDLVHRFHLTSACPIMFYCADESDDGKMLALTIKKRRGAKDTTEWWSGVLEGDDKW